MAWPDTAAIVSIVAGLISLYGLFQKVKGRRLQAAAKFRESVLTELRGLYPRPVEWPEKTGIDHRLRQSFPKLQAAVAAYRPHVIDKAAFDEAWRVYGTGTKRDVDQNVMKNDGKESFKRNVDRLLSFAQDV